MGLIPTKESIIGQFINGRNAQDDFLQLADNHGGTVFGWIDSDGHLQGSLLPSAGTPGGSNTDVQINDNGSFYGDGNFTYNKTTQVIAGTVFNAVTGFQIGGAAASGKFLRGNGTNFISSGIQAGDVTWDQIGNAAGSLTLANGTNATTFNQTTAASWTWANTTAATGGANQNSPIFNIDGTYWTGAVSAVDSWTVQNVVSAGTNPTTTLTFTHSGSSGAPQVSFNSAISCGSINASSISVGSAGMNILNAGALNFQSANNATRVLGQASEEITLSLAGTTTDSSTNLLPAGAIIESVVAYITQTISGGSTPTTWQAGDATTAGRFISTGNALTATTTAVHIS